MVTYIKISELEEGTNNMFSAYVPGSVGSEETYKYSLASLKTNILNEANNNSKTLIDSSMNDFQASTGARIDSLQNELDNLINHQMEIYNTDGYLTITTDVNNRVTINLSAKLKTLLNIP